MIEYTYNTVKELVFDDLKEKQSQGVDIRYISYFEIDGYFQELVRTKAHLVHKALKLGTVNRYVEYFVKKTA